MLIEQASLSCADFFVLEFVACHYDDDDDDSSSRYDSGPTRRTRAGKGQGG